MTNIITVDSIGLSGGLCLLWNDDIQVRQSRSTSFYIETYICDLVVANYQYWYIFVYLSTDKILYRNQLQELVWKSSNWGTRWVINGRRFQ